MTNILFHLYVFFLPLQILKFEDITLLRIIGLFIVVIFFINLVIRMKIEKQIFYSAFFLFLAPLFFIFLEVFRHNEVYRLDIYSPLILNILIFISILNLKNKVNFNTALNTLILSCFLSVVLYFTSFVQVGDHCAIASVPSCHGIGRLSVLHLNPNDSALLISTAFIGLMSKLRIGKNSPYNIQDMFILILSLICLAALGKNGTRFVLLIILAYGIFTLVFCLKTKSYSWLVFLGIAGSIFSIFIFFSKPILILRFIEFFNVVSFSATDSSRLHLWSVAFNAVSNNWLFGIGAFNYSNISSDLFGTWMTPHNMFLEFYIYGGFFGLFLSVPYLWLLYKPSLLLKEDFHIKSLRIGFIILCGSIMFLHHVLFNKLFWVLIIFICVLQRGVVKK